MAQAPDAILFVDGDLRFRLAAQRGQPVDPHREAQGYGMLVNPLGRQPRRIATVAQADCEGQMAYARAQYETICLNGDRERVLDAFRAELMAQLASAPPRHLVLVTTDPRFLTLCAQASALPGVNVNVWAPKADVPPELTEPRFNFRPLEEMLPHLSLPNVDVRLDFENIYRGLIRRGWQPDLPALVAAIKAAAAEFGQLVRVYAYGDWRVLREESGCDLQYELEKLGVRTFYEISLRGKNSADMRLAGDVDLLLTRGGSAPDGADVILLGSLDRDFRSTIERARAGKRIVVLGLREGMSNELRSAAGADIRYLDERLRLRPRSSTEIRPDDLARLVLHTYCWLRERHWYYAYGDELETELAERLGGSGYAARGLEAGVFCHEARPGGPAVRLATDAPLVQAVTHLVEWAPRRVGYCLYEQGRPALNTGFLHKGMSMDELCRRLGVGQTRADAAAWLDLLAEAGLLMKRMGGDVTWWPADAAPAP